MALKAEIKDFEQVEVAEEETPSIIQEPDEAEIKDFVQVEVVIEDAPPIICKRCKTKVSVDTHVGPKRGVGYHIVLDHGAQFHFVEGYYLKVILPQDDNDYSVEGQWVAEMEILLMARQSV